MVHQAKKEDIPAAALLASQLFHCAPEELANEFLRIIGEPDSAVLLFSEDHQVVGFAQCQLRRDYVEGADSSPVGYLEGIFVRPEYRKRGIARELLAACQQWAKEKGCTQFASDCELGNDSSLTFHMKMGFSEANRIICFIKPL